MKRADGSRCSIDLNRTRLECKDRDLITMSLELVDLNRTRLECKEFYNLVIIANCLKFE